MLPIFERVATGKLSSYSLRVSVLEQCQLDCRYCRPGSLSTATDKSRWLTADEHRRLAPLFLARGVSKVRFTGGEPTLRPDLADIIAAWRICASDDTALALTTNALRVRPLLPQLMSAGLSQLTVHLDTIEQRRVTALMGEGADVDVAIDAMKAARDIGLVVKWNVVVQRGQNDDELMAMLSLARALGVEVRFIEQMNTGSARGYVAETFISGKDIVEMVRGVSLPRRQPSDPASLYRAADGTVFGVIASDTEPFCAACDRLRLSADGRVRGCLYQPGGLPLGAALRAGTDDTGLATLLDAAMVAKESYHPLSPRVRTPFSMADVGG